MSTYVISDIHGCYKAFKKLLRKVRFNWKKDYLIIAGDLIDRGPENLKMLRWVEKAPDNITFIMGNHDFDFMHNCKYAAEILKTAEISGDIEKLLESDDYLIMVNDQYGTLIDLLKNCNVTAEDLLRWADIFSKFEYELHMDINDKEYIIVHAGYMDTSAYQNPDFMAVMAGYRSLHHYNIWAREDSLAPGGKEDATIIFGHTPTILQDSFFYNSGRVFQYMNTKNNCRFFNIDCGYVYNSPESNMVIFRLDDEKIFYLNN